MNIRLLSDLHLEFEAFSLEASDADVVVLAGDIHVGTKALDWLSEQKISCPVIYVLGNHEFYKQKYPSHINRIKSSVTRPNTFLLERESIAIDGVRFHGTTLWTNYELFGEPRIAGYECQQVMTDFKKIRKEPSYSKIRALDLSVIHAGSLKWLGESIENSNEETNVVITHHAPSMESVPEHYRKSIITAAYASDLTNFMRVFKPEYWMHGHLHNSSDYLLEGCRVLCNPRGYPGERNPSFDPRFLVKI